MYVIKKLKTSQEHFEEEEDDPQNQPKLAIRPLIFGHLDTYLNNENTQNTWEILKVPIDISKFLGRSQNSSKYFWRLENSM